MGCGLIQREGAVGWTCAMKTKLISQRPYPTTVPLPQNTAGLRAQVGRLTASFMGPKLQGGGN